MASIRLHGDRWQTRVRSKGHPEETVERHCRVHTPTQFSCVEVDHCQRRQDTKSARVRRDRTGQLLIKAVEELQRTGMRITKQAVANLVGRDRPVISRCYRHLLP